MSLLVCSGVKVLLTEVDGRLFLQDYELRELVNGTGTTAVLHALVSVQRNSKATKVVSCGSSPPAASAACGQQLHRKLTRYSLVERRRKYERCFLRPSLRVFLLRQDREEMKVAVVPQMQQTPRGDEEDEDTLAYLRVSGAIFEEQF